MYKIAIIKQQRKVKHKIFFITEKHWLQGCCVCDVVVLSCEMSKARCLFIKNQLGRKLAKNSLSVGDYVRLLNSGELVSKLLVVLTVRKWSLLFHSWRDDALLYLESGDHAVCLL